MICYMCYIKKSVILFIITYITYIISHYYAKIKVALLLQYIFKKMLLILRNRSNNRTVLRWKKPIKIWDINA